ncbi:MAG: sulfatase-like hydrolase/transferase, partial [Fuerstiella sp.]|nr:sulfatase-like hydrolase/transferase [Fuerstiella sp.]
MNKGLVGQEQAEEHNKVMDIICNSTRLRETLHLSMSFQSALRGFMTALLVASFSSSLSAEPSGPNVLLILSDDHSVPHVSCYDDENTRRFRITPNLRKFAEQGMRFDRAYTSAPQCAPSRISIFACRSPVGLGVTRFAQPPRADVRFFTDVLREGGYWVGLDGRHQHLD